MKKIKSLLALATFVIAFATCMENDPGVVAPEEEKPVPTPVGTPIGTPNSKNIGAAGGTINSLDGTIALEIPAGALSADTEISIQPITNLAPNGNGNAYLLGPEGITFNKPIKITFKHGREISATMPALTGIAFQDTDGIWYRAGKFTWDEANKTVSTETTHFSSWGTFDDLKIIPMSTSIIKFDKDGRPSYKLSVNESDEFELVVLGTRDYGNELSPLEPLVETSRNHGFIIEEWSVNGDVNGTTGTYGKIEVNGSDSICTYTAPNTKPEASKNPVILSVELRNLKYKDPRTGQIFNDLMVSVPIEIIGGDYILTLALNYSGLSATSFQCGLGDYTDTTVFDITIAENDKVVLNKINNSNPAFTYNSLGCSCLDMHFSNGSVIEYTAFQATFDSGVLVYELTSTWCGSTDRFQCEDDDPVTLPGLVIPGNVESGNIDLPRDPGESIVYPWVGNGTLTVTSQ